MNPRRVHSVCPNIALVLHIAAAAVAGLSACNDDIAVEHAPLASAGQGGARAEGGAGSAGSKPTPAKSGKPDPSSASSAEDGGTDPRSGEDPRVMTSMMTMMTTPRMRPAEQADAAVADAGMADAGADDCADCIAAECDPELRACADDACALLVACLDACDGDRTCRSDCNDDLEAGVETLSIVLECQGAHCKSACGTQ